MKKNLYIQPVTEAVKVQQCNALCGFSPVIGAPLGGGETPEAPVIIP